MNLSKIFVAWLLTVIIGSLLLSPLGGAIAFISLMFSAACSAPTLIALLIVQYTNSGKDYKTRVKRINLTHIIMFVLTLIVGYIMIESIQYIMIICFYAVVAIVIWLAMFRKEWKEHV